MYDLEFYIYGAGYGPTNETLGKYIREFFGQEPPSRCRKTRSSRPSCSRKPHG